MDTNRTALDILRDTLKWFRPDIMREKPYLLIENNNPEEPLAAVLVDQSREWRIHFPDGTYIKRMEQKGGYGLRCLTMPEFETYVVMKLFPEYWVSYRSRIIDIWEDEGRGIIGALLDEIDRWINAKAEQDNEVQDGN